MMWLGTWYSGVQIATKNSFESRVESELSVCHVSAVHEVRDRRSSRETTESRRLWRQCRREGGRRLQRPARRAADDVGGRNRCDSSQQLLQSASWKSVFGSSCVVLLTSSHRCQQLPRLQTMLTILWLPWSTTSPCLSIKGITLSINDVFLSNLPATALSLYSQSIVFSFGPRFVQAAACS